GFHVRRQRGKAPTQPRVHDTDKAIYVSESAPARDQTDAALPDPATPVHARVQSRYSSTPAQTFPSAICVPALEHLSDSLCAYEIILNHSHAFKVAFPNVDVLGKRLKVGYDSFSAF